MGLKVMAAALSRRSVLFRLVMRGGSSSCWFRDGRRVALAASTKRQTNVVQLSGVIGCQIVQIVKAAPTFGLHHEVIVRDAATVLQPQRIDTCGSVRPSHTILTVRDCGLKRHSCTIQSPIYSSHVAYSGNPSARCVGRTTDSGEEVPAA